MLLLQGTHLRICIKITKRIFKKPKCIKIAMKGFKILNLGHKRIHSNPNL